MEKRNLLKFFLLFLVLCLSTALFACNPKTEEKTKEKTEEKTQEVTPEKTPEVTEPEKTPEATKPVHEHELVLKSDDTNHWEECSCGHQTAKEAHKGGTATATERAKCEVCNKEYGELKDSLKDKYNCISIEEAISIANKAGETATADKYYIYGVIKEVQNEQYGQMLITDGTNTLFIYGTYSADGTLRYSALEEKPVAGDEVVLYGTLQMYGGKPEVYAGWIIEFATEEDEKTPTTEVENNPIVPEGTGIWTGYDLISIEYAIYLANLAGDTPTADRYYIYATIKTVSNPEYGEMTITDGENDLYVYGTYSADGVDRYSTLEEKPVAGDEVVLSVNLSTFKSSPQAKSGWIVKFNHKAPVLDLTKYTSASIAEAREAEKGENLIVTGTVAQITYAFGKIPSGVMLIEDGASIYVYGKDVAGQVQIGNTITVAATKDYYVLADEAASAQKFGYKGCNQLTNAFLLENDKKVSKLDLSFAEETTIKELMETAPSADISTAIYKVNALVKKVPGNNFVNYYIDDIDGVTGTYVYTQCSGSDFDWLDEFDGKICTVYVTVFNYKSNSTSCIARFLPILVEYENYEFDLNNACDYVLEYHGLGQLLDEYSSDPAIEMITSVSNELIGLENAKLSYSSSDENVVYFEELDGKVIFHTKDAGTAEITITATYGTASESVKVNVVSKIAEQYDTITVKEAFEEVEGEVVTVRGIVSSSLVNRTGFYLVDETGVIAVCGIADSVALLSSGDEIVVRGTKAYSHKSDCSNPENHIGQNFINNAEILVNYYGDNEYSTATFKTGKSITELNAFDVKTDYSGDVYVVNAIITVNETAYYTNITINDPANKAKYMNLYCSSASQYNFLKPYAGQEVTLELALCNWNCKKYYAGCVISATINGEKIINTLNFN